MASFICLDSRRDKVKVILRYLILEPRYPYLSPTTHTQTYLPLTASGGETGGDRPVKIGALWARQEAKAKMAGNQALLIKL